MTREEIIQNIKARISTIESYRPDEYALNEGNLFELKDLLTMIEKDEPSIPSNLDEAAEEFEKHAMEDYDEICVNEDGSESPVLNCDLKDAFKAGAKWRDAQIQKLPNNLDEATKKKARDIFESLEKHDIGEEKNRVLFGLLELEALALTFSHFGAKWMAGQGYTKEGIARPDDCEIWVNLTGTDIKDGDKVIVQIQKK